MRSHCRNKFVQRLQELRKLPGNRNCTQAVLILDQQTTALVTSLLSLQLLFDCGISSITRVNLAKKPEPSALAIYYISTASLSHALHDFKEAPIYFSVNLLFCQNVEPEVMQALSAEKAFLQRLASFGELHLNTKYIADSLALISLGNSLTPIFSQNAKSSVVTANRIFEALICGFGEQVDLELHIQESLFCRAVSTQLLNLLGKHQEAISKGENDQKRRRKVGLLLFDRSFDVASPAIRSFHYLPMLMDIFNTRIEQIRLTINQKEISLALDTPHLFTYRSKHLSEVLQLIREDLKIFTQTNQAAKMQKNGDFELKEVVKGLSDYTKTVNSFNEHMSIMNELSVRSKQIDLPSLGQLQHSAVSGMNSKGDSVKDGQTCAKILEAIEKIINPQQDQPKPMISTKEQIVRFLFIAIVCLELSQSDRQVLLERLKKLGYESLAAFLQGIESTFHFPQKCEIKPSGKESLYLNRHRCQMATAFESVLRGKSSKLKSINCSQDKISERFRRLGGKEEREWVVCMCGSIGVNQIVQLDLQAVRYKTSVNVLTDAVVTPMQYFQLLSTWRKM